MLTKDKSGGIHIFMNKNSEAIKNRIGIITIWAFVIAIFGILITFIAISLSRVNFAKKYTLEIADYLNGSNKIFSEHNEEIFELDRQNVIAIAKLSTSGSIMWGEKSENVSGNLIKLTSISKEDESRKYIYIEETTQGKALITLESNGETESALLNDVKYNNFLKCVKLKGPQGDNTPIEAVP